MKPNPPNALPSPAASAQLLQLARQGVPMWVGAAVLATEQALISSTQRHAAAGGRQHTAAALEVLRDRRDALMQAVARAIEQRLDEAGSPAPAAVPAATGAGPLKLTLIDEAQIDEDIETAHVVQAIEAEAEEELHALAALASGLLGLPGIEPAAVPLTPLLCAGAARAALAGLGLEPGPRALLLRHFGSALGQELRREYTRLSTALAERGVQPAQYRIVQAPAQRGPGHAAPAGAEVEARPLPRKADAPPSLALQRLVDRARVSLAAAEAAEPVESAEGPGLSLRLFDEPLPAGLAHRALDPAAAVQLMERLCAQIEQQLGTTPRARASLAGLREPARALARHEPQLWTGLDHPWWQFLDRLIAMASVQDEPGDGHGPVTESMAQVMDRLREAPRLDRATCQAAATELQQVADGQLSDRGLDLQSRAGELQHQVDRQEVEIELRNQIVQQLRSTPVCPGLRQFLVGPWTQVMTEATLREGAGGASLDALALVVDDLIRATSQPGRSVSRAQRAVLLRQVQEGMLEAGLPGPRVQAEGADLAALLNDPPALQAESWEEAPPDTLPVGLTLDLMGGLPTVPIEMAAGADSTLAVAGHRDWLDALEPGTYCRLFLMGRWMTAQLSWVSDSHNLYLFSSRHGARVHSLTRRMLGKLRNAGLATSIEDGYLLAQALDTLADTAFTQA